VIDLGGAAVLHGKYHVDGLEAKAISTAAATVVTYLGSRFWTFKDRENQSLRR
jgi:putative flippase GtrA